MLCGPDDGQSSPSYDHGHACRCFPGRNDVYSDIL